MNRAFWRHLLKTIVPSLLGAACTLYTIDGLEWDPRIQDGMFFGLALGLGTTLIGSFLSFSRSIPQQQSTERFESIIARAKQICAATAEVSRILDENARATGDLLKNSALEQMSMDKCLTAVSQLQQGMTVAESSARSAIELALECQAQAQQGASQLQTAFAKVSGLIRQTREIQSPIQELQETKTLVELLRGSAQEKAIKNPSVATEFETYADELSWLESKLSAVAIDLNRFVDFSAQEVTVSGNLTDSAQSEIKKMIDTISKTSAQIQSMSKDTLEHAQLISTLSEHIAVLNKTMESNSTAATAVGNSAKELAAQTQSLLGFSEDLGSREEAEEKTDDIDVTGSAAA